MTTQNTTIVFEVKGALPRDFTPASDQEAEDFLAALFSGTEAQNEQCCGEPEDCALDRFKAGHDDHEQANEPIGTWYTPAPSPEQRNRSHIGQVRGLLQDVLVKVPLDEQVVQYLFEADGALEDAQQHIAEQAEQTALQAEEDDVVDEWRIAIMKASNVTGKNLATWGGMAEDTRIMWRERFYGNLEWCERFAKENK